MSPQVTDKTQMLYRRNIIDRARELAPFLTFDDDPYVVVVDGRVYWILDAYTTGSTYPYSQASTFPAGSTSEPDINYIRNSVKVVIDAYEGTADFYVIDPNDPIIKAYEATFPIAVQAHRRDAERAARPPARADRPVQRPGRDLRDLSHQRPEGLLRARGRVGHPDGADRRHGSGRLPVQPYYVLFRLPGETNPEFLLIMPFTPLGKQNLVSWLAVRNDGAHYGQYVSYVLPKDKVIFGPQQIANRINQEPAISRDFTLFDQAGSHVQQGNLLVVPIGNSFLYFEPIYLRATLRHRTPGAEEGDPGRPDECRLHRHPAAGDRSARRHRHCAAADKHASDHAHASPGRPDRRPGDAGQHALRRGLRGAQGRRPSRPTRPRWRRSGSSCNSCRR